MSIKRRIKSLEKLLEPGSGDILAVAIRDHDGYHWGGRVFATGEELNEAFKVSPIGKDGTLIVISKVRLPRD